MGAVQEACNCLVGTPYRDANGVCRCDSGGVMQNTTPVYLNTPVNRFRPKPILIDPKLEPPVTVTQSGASATSIISGIPNWLLLGGGALALFMVFKDKK